MRYIVKRKEMQALDAYSIEEIGIPALVLMERAAMAVADVILDHTAEWNRSGPPRILIVTESGNNGGDGLAAARMLYEQGCQVQVCQIGGVKKESPQYQQQKKILEQLGIPVVYGVTEEIVQEWKRIPYDVIVDAIFGIGLQREIESPQREVIETLNDLKGLKCAVDIPSGIDGTDGRILGIAFRADVTITFGWEKTGQLLGAGPEYCGSIWTADIGFPGKAAEEKRPECYCYEEQDLMRLPARSTVGNKGTFGRVAVIAGSEQICGAALLSAGGAYRTGCGLVQVVTHVNNREAVQKLLPEALLQVYDSREDALRLVAEAGQWADIMVIGPGIGTGETGRAMTLQALALDCPLVADADAITILSRQEEWWKQRKAYNTKNGPELGMILTPHMKEMERISGIPIQELKERPWDGAGKLAETGAVCVLKDARTIVSEPYESGCYINLSGNDGMAVGGAGDVLTGVIASLAAQGLPLGEAARLGVYLHGLGGDRAAEVKGHYGMLASDIIEGVTDILKDIDTELGKEVTG